MPQALHRPHGRGVFPRLTVEENLMMGAYFRSDRDGIRADLEQGFELFSRLRERRSQTAGTLSGGNQQKIVLAKWLIMEPKVIIFDEPTRGIDVGSKNEIYRLMRDLSDNGVAVLMISSDMEEVVGVSDRVAVMHSGEISGILERANLSEHNVLQLAVGNRAGVN